MHKLMTKLVHPTDIYDNLTVYPYEKLQFIMEDLEKVLLFEKGGLPSGTNCRVGIGFRDYLILCSF